MYLYSLTECEPTVAVPLGPHCVITWTTREPHSHVNSPRGCAVYVFLLAVW